MIMEIMIELQEGLFARPETAGGHVPGPPDWAALRARLLAARDASRELSRASSRQARGSFASDVACQLSAQEETGGAVNPTNSGNLKWETAKVEPVAGYIGIGGRGQT
ncbi:hypothetical protein [Novosphingobium aquimarinum]|uniref:hypothetical protein n=1 Tax=Novosphingobium aquimarinum TaxID=2682494 RepID=UPI0018DC847C|nr:hypothetical protein [Novosphingobium aquimarinum]